MTTLLNEAFISSIALMSGIFSPVRIKPSKTLGIRFHLNNHTVKADIDNVVSTDHCVSIGNGEVTISLIEHFMAACAICAIDSLDVYLEHNELPILDGSAKDWVDLFDKVGIEHSVHKVWGVKEPVAYLNGKTHLVILPAEKLEISYAVNYNHPDLKNRWTSYSRDPLKDNLYEIKEARTFGYLSELEALQAQGFARGVSIENTVGLTDTDYTSTLRSEFEPIKHKILDLIGDLYLIGVNPLKLNCHIIVKEAGHAVHVKAAKLLKDKLYKE